MTFPLAACRPKSIARAIGAPADVINPVLVSLAVADYDGENGYTSVVATFSEPMATDSTPEAGATVEYVNLASWEPLGILGAVIAGPVVTYSLDGLLPQFSSARWSYNSGVGGLQDLAENPLPSYTNEPINTNP